MVFWALKIQDIGNMVENDGRRGPYKFGRLEMSEVT
jgi:hypothetical protein